jgi:hypothetical protein
MQVSGQTRKQVSRGLDLPFFEGNAPSCRSRYGGFVELDVTDEEYIVQGRLLGVRRRKWPEDSKHEKSQNREAKIVASGSCAMHCK